MYKISVAKSDLDKRSLSSVMTSNVLINPTLLAANELRLAFGLHINHNHETP